MLTKILKNLYIICIIIAFFFGIHQERKSCNIKILREQEQYTKLTKQKNIEIDQLELEYNKELLKYKNKEYNSCDDIILDINDILLHETHK